MSLHMKFSGTLLQKRRELKLTQQQMADRCGIALRTYQGLEAGHELPTFQTAAKIACSCEISLDSIVKEMDPNAFSLSAF